MVRVHGVVVLLLYYSWNPVSYANLPSVLGRSNLRMGTAGRIGICVSRISPFEECVGSNAYVVRD